MAEVVRHSVSDKSVLTGSWVSGRDGIARNERFNFALFIAIDNLPGIGRYLFHPSTRVSDIKFDMHAPVEALGSSKRSCFSDGHEFRFSGENEDVVLIATGDGGQVSPGDPPVLPTEVEYDRVRIAHRGEEGITRAAVDCWPAHGIAGSRQIANKSALPIGPIVQLLLLVVVRHHEQGMWNSTATHSERHEVHPSLRCLPLASTGDLKTRGSTCGGFSCGSNYPLHTPEAQSPNSDAKSQQNC